MALEDAKHLVDEAFTREDLKGLSFENTFGGATSFLRRKYSKDLSGVDIAVTGVPFDQAVTNRPGTRLGPRAIREASALQSPDAPYGWGYDPLSEFAIIDYGDLAFDYANIAGFPDALREHIRGILAADVASVVFNYITNDLGQLCQTIGPVNNIECFYEYQLSCKDLNISNKNFTKMVNNINYSHDNYSIDNAITIDSLDTQDYDDAISFNNNCISVHISNVPIYIEKHNLWNYINKVSTIYLPDKKRSMLPTKLTDNILSLKAGEKRDVFSMNIQFDENNNISINFSKDIIKIRKNHIYESEKLLNDNIYKNINDKVHILLPKYPYVHHVSNSHELIEYLMIFMNAQCAIKLHESSVGIYRSLILESNRESEIDDPIIRKFISYWKNSKSEYTIKPDHEHQLLMLKDYVHITSPIRRLVDIVNMMMLQHVLNIYIFGNNALTFYNYHTNNLIAINKSVKDIKRIQNDCTILQYYWEKSSLNEYNELMDVTLDNNRAYVIDILDNNEYQDFRR